MLVSGLINEALSTKISSSNGDYAGVYQALCECAQEMVDKYRQKQETPENKSKLEVKTRAATILHQELGKVPRGVDADAIHKALSSALERHADELQGCEHLISEKSSNYALVKQTQGLIQQAGAPVSLLRYHNLKNNLLGPDSAMNDKQKEFISEWAEKKYLTVELLDFLDKNPDFLTKDRMSLMRQHKEGRLEPEQEPELNMHHEELASRHERPVDYSMKALFLCNREKLLQLGLSEADFHDDEVVRGIKLSGRFMEN